MKKMLFLLCLFSLVFGFSSQALAFDGYNNPIRVLLSSTASPQSVTVTYSNYTLVNSNGGVVANLTAGQNYTLNQGETLSSDNGYGRFAYNNIEYRGDLCFHNGFIVNKLGMEEYLLSVVMNEIGGYSPNIEAIKAQAVASRSYGCVGKKNPRNPNYDIFTDTRDQYYGGFTDEKYNAGDSVSARIRQACKATENQVVYYRGNLAKTICCANTGGYSEDAQVVWGGSYPYMKGIVAPWDSQSFVGENYGASGTYKVVKMPTSYGWTKTFNVNDIVTKVEKQAGKTIGKLKDIIVENTDSGYAKTITFDGTANDVAMKGSDLRSLLGLRSGNFDVILGYHLGTAQDFPLQLLDTAKFTELFNKNVETATFEGRGYGHNVGMSQWSACVMAYKGMDYQYILNYFYNQNKNDGAMTIENFRG
ncbi:MAG: SpoIID/LytB domain-containing protein [Clostridiales bacterium]